MISVALLAVVTLLGAVSGQQECSFQSSDTGYSVSWAYDAQNRRVTFTIDAKLPDNSWTGIGFGRTMRNGDIIAITNLGGRLNISDRHGTGYQEPVLDSKQNAEDFSGKVENGVVHATFSRLVDTADRPDDNLLEDPSLNNCQFFMFPISGGQATGDESKVVLTQHVSTPTTKLICNISRCTSRGQQPNGIGAGLNNNGIASEPARDSVLSSGTVTNSVASQRGSAESGRTTLVGGPSTQPTQQPGGPVAVASTQSSGAPQQGASAAGGIVESSSTSGSITTGSSSGPVGAAVSTQAAPGGAGGAEGAQPSESACEYSDGRYKAQWSFNEATKRVTFTLTAPLQQSRWTGIGFGQQMQGGDMIVIQDNNGALKATDRNGIGHQEPAPDAHQDVENFKGTVNAGILQATFNRLLDTGDKEDLIIDDPAQNNCQYFIFPIAGGNVDAQGKIQVHDNTPKVKLICNVKQCKKPSESGQGAPGGVTESTQSTASASGEAANAAAGGAASAGAAGQGAAAGGQGAPSPGSGSQSRQGEGASESQGNACPARQDHSACRTYIDDYLSVVYSRFPKTDAITQKACSLLSTHQEGVVLRECCHYLSGQCGRFIESSIAAIPQGTSGGTSGGNSGSNSGSNSSGNTSANPNIPPSAGDNAPSGAVTRSSTGGSVSTPSSGEVQPNGNIPTGNNPSPANPSASNPISGQPQPSNPSQNQAPNPAVSPNVAPNTAGNPNANAGSNPNQPGAGEGPEGAQPGGGNAPGGAVPASTGSDGPQPGVARRPIPNQAGQAAAGQGGPRP